MPDFSYNPWSVPIFPNSQDQGYDPFAAEKFVPPQVAQALPQVAQNDVAGLQHFWNAPFAPTPPNPNDPVAFPLGKYGNITEGDLNRATNIALSAGPGTIKAYHGSPHDFDAFSMDKIGTGEGAQAYGHGLYFAENEGVAKAYRDKLADNWAIDGKPADPSNPSHIAASTLKYYNGDRPSAIYDLQNVAKSGPATERQAASDAVDLLKKNADLPDAVQSGKMYEVQINADPEHFLDWDKPLSEQPPIVQEMARNADLSHLAPGNRTRRQIEMWREGTLPNKESEPSGNVLHSALTDYGMNTGNNAALTDQFRQAGIPGIKYLDQGSRGAGEGSRNYVVFDDNLISILRKYGIVGALGLGAPLFAPQESKS